MKKIIALFLAVTLLLANLCPVLAKEEGSDGYNETIGEMDFTEESQENVGEEVHMDTLADNHEESEAVSSGSNQTESIQEYTDSCGKKGEEDHGSHEIMPVYNDDKSAYSLTLSDKRISFGKNTVGYPIGVQTVTITNTGNTQVNLIWKDVDPDCAFIVDATKAVSIAPGKSAPIYIAVATNKGAGAYNGVFLFADSSDTAYASGVKLETSVTIEADSSKIKSFSLIPGETSAAPNCSVNFSTDIQGEGNIDKSVVYSVAGNKSTDTYIDEKGKLNIASNETAPYLTVKAVSVQDNSIYKEARVNIKNNTYTVNVYSSPYNGGDVTGGGAYNQGSKVVLRAYAFNGWYQTGWRINGGFVSAGSNYTIDSIDKSYDIAAIFERDSIRIKAEPNHEHMGEIEGDGYYNIGDNVTLTAKAKKGYRFSCWMEGRKKLSTDSKLKLKRVDEDRKITAIFVKDECVVSVASCDEAMGSVSGGKKTEYGKDVTIKAVPKEGFSFVCWVCNDQKISTQPECVLKDMKDDITVVAVFAPKKSDAKRVFTMTSGTTDPNGVISPSGEIVLEQGKSINYTITPKSGYRIAALLIDGKQVAVTSSVTISDINSNHTVVAAFAPISDNVALDVEKIEQSQSEAETSDIHSQVQHAPQKEYVENLVQEEVDISRYVGDEDDSMDNSLDDEEGVLQEINISTKEATELLGDDSFKYELVRQAISSENLEVNIDNSMRKNKFVMSYEDKALENPETANFAEILCGVFTDQEVMDMASGRKRVYVDVSITSAQEEYVPIGDISKIKSGVPDNMKPGQYFYANFMKSVDGAASEVLEFSRPLMVKVDIPDRIFKKNGNYKIARLHTNADGSEELSILEDTDTDPSTITFETDRFSTYAILCDSNIDVDTNQPLERPVINRADSDKAIIIVGAVCIVLTIICCGIITGVIIRRRKRGKKR